MESLSRMMAVGMLMVMAVAAGCGYRMSDGGYLEENVSQVAVTVFANKTSESRAGVSFTNELIREITHKSDTRVVDVENATRVITGTVKAITFSALSRSSTQTVVERDVTARVDVKLTGPGGNVLWSVKDFSASESYVVSSGSADDQAAKDQAVDTIAERVAERLVSQMMSRF